MTTLNRVPRRQRGVALVIGLIFLVVISLIATVGMRQSITQERMAGGLRQESLARSGAETAARAGERQLFDHYLTSNGTVRGSGGAGNLAFYTNEQAAEDFRNARYEDFYTTGADPVDSSWLNLVSGPTTTAALARQPVFIIEELGPVRPPSSGPGGEGGASGGANYEGSGGGSPGGNSDLMLYRITARATGGVETVVRTVETTFVVRR